MWILLTYLASTNMIYAWEYDFYYVYLKKRFICDVIFLTGLDIVVVIVNTVKSFVCFPQSYVENIPLHYCYLCNFLQCFTVIFSCKC